MNKGGLFFIFILLCSCAQPTKYSKEDKVFRKFLSMNEIKNINENQCNILIIPESGCKGCINKALELVHHCNHLSIQIIDTAPSRFPKKYLWPIHSESTYKVRDLFFVYHYPLLITYQNHKIDTLVELKPDNVSTFSTFFNKIACF